MSAMETEYETNFPKYIIECDFCDFELFRTKMKLGAYSNWLIYFDSSSKFKLLCLRLSDNFLTVTQIN